MFPAEIFNKVPWSKSCVQISVRFDPWNIEKRYCLFLTSFVCEQWRIFTRTLHVIKLWNNWCTHKEEVLNFLMRLNTTCFLWITNFFFGVLIHYNKSVLLNSRRLFPKDIFHSQSSCIVSLSRPLVFSSYSELPLQISQVIALGMLYKRIMVFL